VRILVTGGAGFIGSNLVPRLTDLGHDVTVLDNLSVGQQPPPPRRSVTFYRGDFLRKEVLADCLDGADVVVHLAAMPGVMDSIEDPVKCFMENVDGMFRLLEAARCAKIAHFVNASTGGAILGDVTPPISETMAPEPMSPYGASKLATEGFCTAYSASYGLPCVSLRFSNIYGPNSAHKKSVVSTFVKAALQDGRVTIYGDGTQQRDYLFVDDLARGITAAITARVSGTFQLGSGKPTALLDLIRGIEAVSDRRLRIDHQPARRGEVHSTWCDVAKARDRFHYTAPTALTEGLKATWLWFAANQFKLREHDVNSSAD
jgi:UDP-glucose 4-epimerase